MIYILINIIHIYRLRTIYFYRGDTIINNIYVHI